MNISIELTDELLKYLDRKVQSGLYKSRSEFVRTIIRFHLEREKRLDKISEQLRQEMEEKGVTYEDLMETRKEVAREIIEERYPGLL